MRRESINIALACAVGALIGALVSIEIAERFAFGQYVWFVGALLGGGIAYCLVDFGEFCAGVRHAYFKTIDWRPHPMSFRAAFAMFCAYTMMTQNMFFIIFLAVPVYIAGKDFEFWPWLAFSLLALGIGLLASVAIWRGRQNATNWAWLKHQRVMEKQGWKMFYWANVIGLSIWLIFLVGWLLWNAIIRIPRAYIATYHGIGWLIRQASLFLKHLFIQIHSQRRVLCFVDASFGAAAGFYFGNAIIGMAVGALLGLLNYELVSVRWLKLAPTRSR